MEPLATLDQLRQIDYQSRRDRCTGLIAPAVTLFAKRIEAKAPQISERDRHAPLIFIGVGILLYFLLKGEGENLVWTAVFSAAALVYVLYLSRHIDNWLRFRRIREIDEQLSMLSAFWMGAGGSRDDFYGLQHLLVDGEIDFDSEDYKHWFYGFDRFLRIHCGLEYSGFDKPLHQFKKSA